MIADQEVIDAFVLTARKCLDAWPLFPSDTVTPPRDRRILAVVDGEVRIVLYGKTSHVPLYGFNLADQGPEEFDLCEFDLWMEMPRLPTKKVSS